MKKQNPVPFETYFGGKSGAGTYQTIINHIPPHRIFMSLFAGNCGIFKNIRRAEYSVINDIDSSVSNAWSNIHDDILVLQKDAIDFLKTDIFNIEYKKQWKHIFIFLDPPYLMATRKRQNKIYNFEFSEDQHIALLDCVLSLPPGINIMISHYPCPLYDDKLKNWQKVSFQSSTRHGSATENIYFNYSLNGELHDYSYIGQNFRHREKYKRIKDNFFLKLNKMEPLLRNALLQEYQYLASHKR